jgi:hypothetical protein
VTRYAASIDLTGGSKGRIYTVLGKCSNCGWEGTVYIRCGEIRPIGNDANNCPLCECRCVTCYVMPKPL